MQWDQKSSENSGEALRAPGSGRGLQLSCPGLHSVFVTLTQVRLRASPGCSDSSHPYSRHAWHSPAQTLVRASIRSTLSAKILA